MHKGLAQLALLLQVSNNSVMSRSISLENIVRQEEVGPGVCQLYAKFVASANSCDLDNNVGSSAAKSPFFAMSADNSRVDDITIPVIFLFHLESQKLQNQLLEYPTMIVSLAEKAYNPGNF